MDITASGTPALDAAADHLLIFATRDDDILDGGALRQLNEALDGGLAPLIKSGELSGSVNETVVVHTFGKTETSRVVIAGLGPAEKMGLDEIRHAAANGARKARSLSSGALAVAVDGEECGFTTEEIAGAICEGLDLGLYRFDRHQSPKRVPNVLERVSLHSQNVAGVEAGIPHGRSLAGAANFARDLANEPSNLLTPTELANRAEAWAADHDVEIEVMDEATAAELGMGSFLGVAKGSHQPAKFLILRHRGGADEPGLGYCGKGITFDTGGISIKPAANMEAMKQDMSGAAAVVASMGAIADLKLPINVTALAPCTENMPGGNAIKPGDLLTAMNGATIEVINTDAEGRLVLADALSYANHLGLSPLIDVATLTGAVAVALGDVATGVMANDDNLAAEVIEAGKRAGEKFWQLPMFPEYDDQIRSQVADVKNTGGRLAGAITAAKFLARFAGDTPWAHLDMAGTDDASKTRGTQVKGASGVPVRSLVRFAAARAEASA
ncbi:MAG: leucyl aminopeptidase [Chloroflexi bacterium]|nr:leucyl aminopeptidase [Chloroflexota bacterium]MYC00364.1 leucyl aminopeptidase [Chloroflexota bacterium]